MGIQPGTSMPAEAVPPEPLLPAEATDLFDTSRSNLSTSEDEYVQLELNKNEDALRDTDHEGRDFDAMTITSYQSDTELDETAAGAVVEAGGINGRLVFPVDEVASLLVSLPSKAQPNFSITEIGKETRCGCTAQPAPNASATVGLRDWVVTFTPQTVGKMLLEVTSAKGDVLIEPRSFYSFNPTAVKIRVGNYVATRRSSFQFDVSKSGYGILDYIIQYVPPPGSPEEVTPLQNTIVPLSGGLYEVQFCCEHPGQYQIVVLFNKRTVHDSPFIFTCTAVPEVKIAAPRAIDVSKGSCPVSLRQLPSEDGDYVLFFRVGRAGRDMEAQVLEPNRKFSFPVLVVEDYYLTVCLNGELVTPVPTLVRGLASVVDASKVIAIPDYIFVKRITVLHLNLRSIGSVKDVTCEVTPLDAEGKDDTPLCGIVSGSSPLYHSYRFIPPTAGQYELKLFCDEIYITSATLNVVSEVTLLWGLPLLSAVMQRVRFDVESPLDLELEMDNCQIEFIGESGCKRVASLAQYGARRCSGEVTLREAGHYQVSCHFPGGLVSTSELLLVIDYSKYRIQDMPCQLARGMPCRFEVQTEGSGCSELECCVTQIEPVSVSRFDPPEQLPAGGRETVVFSFIPLDYGSCSVQFKLFGEVIETGVCMDTPSTLALSVYDKSADPLCVSPRENYHRLGLVRSLLLVSTADLSCDGETTPTVKGYEKGATWAKSSSDLVCLVLCYVVCGNV